MHSQLHKPTGYERQKTLSALSSSGPACKRRITCCIHFTRLFVPNSTSESRRTKGLSNLTKGRIVAAKPNWKQVSPESLGFVDRPTKRTGATARTGTLWAQTRNCTPLCIHSVTYMGRSLLHPKIAPSLGGIRTSI